MDGRVSKESWDLSTFYEFWKAICSPRNENEWLTPQDVPGDSVNGDRMVVMYANIMYNLRRVESIKQRILVTAPSPIAHFRAHYCPKFASWSPEAFV